MKKTRSGMTVCCRVGTLLVGIDLDRVQEINQRIEPTYVPLMPPHIRGLINLRGNLVAMIDLGHVLQGQPTANGRKARSVVVELADEVCGFLVAEVGDVLDLAAVKCEPMPSHLPPSQRQWFSGMVQLPSDLLLLLDVDAVGNFGLVPNGRSVGA
jgi:purine-binding chemotaxis protein CheW